MVRSYLRYVRCAHDALALCPAEVTFVIDAAVAGSARPRGVYNGAMSKHANTDRILDKGIVLLCCLMAVSHIFSADRQVLLVAAFLAAIICACAAELGHGWWRVLPGAAFCVLSCFVSDASVFAPLCAYDLARVAATVKVPESLAVRLGLAGALVAAPLVAFASAHSQVLAVPALGACTAGVATLLALRTVRAEKLRAENIAQRDSLQGRALALAAQNRNLQERRTYEMQVATLTERARISREIHDNTGHMLTRAIMQTEALKVVHAGEPVAAELEAVGATLGQALSGMRASVHALHEESEDVGVTLHEIAAAATVPTSCSVSAEDVPANVAACASAVVREALSNTARHGNATQSHVEFLEHPAFYRLTVTDNGMPGFAAEQAGCLGEAAARVQGTAVEGCFEQGFNQEFGKAPAGEEPVSEALSAKRFAAGVREGGMGLASMRERVEALGGTFRAGFSSKGGFEVFASIPKQTQEQL